MSIYENLRNQAKIDSRRFGKGIVCRIVYGQLLGFIQAHGLVPRSIYFSSQTGLDPANFKILLIPVTKYDEIINLLNNNDAKGDPNSTEISEINTQISANDPLIAALKQNIILATIDYSSIPEGVKVGAPPEAYDVLIDSIDVNQNIVGQYTYRNFAQLREFPQWSRR